MYCTECRAGKNDNGDTIEIFPFTIQRKLETDQ